MHQNIKNKHSRVLDSKLFNQKYYDYMLHKGEAYNQSLNSIEEMAIADFSDFIFENGKLYSSIYWSGSTNNGVLLKDIGMTGVDNGFISYDKTALSVKDFLDIFFKSEYKIESGDTRLFLSPVSGNTQLYNYESELVESGDTKYMKFNGGFYQGFFKLFGFDYQVLPHNIYNDMVLHFEIRPRTDYTQAENSISKSYPQNNGIFFYMGARAENKFWGLYDNIEYMRKYVCDPYSNYENDGYFSDEDFLEEEPDITNPELIDSEGMELGDNESYEITTDNKFIFFNRTGTGFTVDNWVDGAIVKLKDKKRRNINYFPWLNRTETGYTVDNIEELDALYDLIAQQNGELSYDPYKDIKNNVFALRITENGAIGYKYGILDCDNEDHHYSVIEEYSKDGMVKPNEWNSINVRFAIINPTSDKCDLRQRKMRIMIYVNGYLKFISKQLNALSFKELNDLYQRQEGVPYNISLGGGSIGLKEMVLPPDFYDIPGYILPIEKDFCGSFIGDIKSFKIYLGLIDYYSIKNYLS